MYINNIKVFNKGDVKYALIYLVNKVNLFIRVKCEIIDIQYQEKYPVYIIKIIDFLEDFDFLKEHYLGGTLKYSSKQKNVTSNSYTKSVSTNRLKNIKNINTISDILYYYHNEFDYTLGSRRYKNIIKKHYLIIESIYVFDDYDSMNNANTAITNFHVIELFKDIKKYLFRDKYQNELDCLFNVSIDDYNEFLYNITKINKYNDLKELLENG